jgi:hypothetical protein
MNVKKITICDIARQRHQTLLKWRTIWTILLFVFGSVIISFYTVAIFLLIKELWLYAALATLSSIVSGVGINWVWKRRNESVREEERAYTDVIHHFES